MAETTAIAWADATFNPWIGCTNVSPGCDHCYAEALDATRFSKTLGGATKEIPIVHWGAGAPRHRTSIATWRQPLVWERKAKKSGTSPRVFCASLADVFDNEVPDEWRRDLWALIEATPHLTWLLLTKRIGNLGRNVSYPLLQNVWLGATVVTREEAERDIPKLLRMPARVRFLSCEPLLEALDLTPFLERGTEHMGHHEFPALDWVICGGESGTKARPFDLAWARSLRDQCAAARVPFFMKQVGARPFRPAAAADADTPVPLDTPSAWAVPFNLRDRAGADPAEWPQDLRVQEFPC